MLGQSAKTFLNCSHVHDQWIGWLNQAFQHKQTHDALLDLLINGIKDPRFVNESIVYGKDLVFHAVKQQSVIDASRDMSVNVLVNEKRVVDQAVELCKWFVLNDSVYQISKDYMSAMCLRADVFDVMMWQLACGAMDALQGEGDSEETTPVRTCMMRVGMGYIARPEFQAAATSSFLHFPVIDTLTLGMYALASPKQEAFALDRERFPEELLV